MERFLQFVMSHNATIIEILFGLTLLGVSFLAVRSFLLAKEPSNGGAALDMGNLETMLQQILEKAGSVPSIAGSPGGGGGGSEDSQRLLAEITNLKTDLEAKKKQIDDMKTATASAPAPGAGGLSAEEKAGLDDKIRELQAKLSEYEIISEDIADLSFYKEQNAKLQKELDGLKAGGAVAAAPAPAAPTPAPAPAAAAPPPPPPPPPKEEPAIVGKSMAAEASAAPAPAAPAPAPAEATAPAVPELAIDDDLMAEFAAAVEKQKSPDAAAPAATAAPSAPAAPTPEATSPKAEGEADLGTMDMDKMLAEAAGIQNDGPEVSAEAALGTSLDENKLLQEAAALGSVSAEDKKLMGDFENFVKKGES